MVVRKRKKKTTRARKKPKVKKPSLTKKYQIGVFDPMLVINGGEEQVFPEGTIIKFKIKNKIFRAKIDEKNDCLNISVLGTEGEHCSVLPYAANNFSIK